MRVLDFSDAHHFLERAREFLFRDEIRHNLLLSSALTLSKTLPRQPTPTRSPALIFLATEPKDGAALRSPNHRWIVDADNTQAALALAHEISKREAKTRLPLRSVMLPRELSPVFTDFQVSTSEREPLTLNPRTTQNLMSLSKLKTIEPSAGLLRFALPKDIKLLITWSKRFAEEGGLDESPREAEDIIQKYFDTKQLFVWENHGRAIAMAAIGGFTPHAARISMVYTNPTDRGHGYASTLVHRVSHKILQDGKTCVLFADAGNTTTKDIYERLGYRTVEQFTELRAQPVVTTDPTSGSKVTITG